MAEAPETLVGTSLKWTGVHHSELGDFKNLSTHTVSYETETTCYVTSESKLVGESQYTYKRLDEQMGICIYRPYEYQGRSDVVLNAIFDFRAMKDRAVLTSSGEPFAAADGDMEFVETPRPDRPGATSS
ncbi:hypothetical protein [Ruegeria sp. Alg231-54]|uniref:hypothetical protein n=1 Tax=Ruegeria sp. Alg231-54 TaxID=1922221 RepID=UPI0018FFF584|nr:hypothetical protein [Ruegeria sp. Alg231-54]